MFSADCTAKQLTTDNRQLTVLALTLSPLRPPVLATPVLTPLTRASYRGHVVPPPLPSSPLLSSPTSIHAAPSTTLINLMTYDVILI